ncbi:amidase signature domain-containing protein, partial [Aspergillus oleicola]
EQPTVKSLTQQELWNLCSKRDQYRAKYARAWTNSGAEDGQEVDVVLCPASFGAATPHDQSRYWGYTANWNLLDYPGAVFPVTTVDPVKDPVDTTYVPKNDQDSWAHDMYSPEKYTDAPVSLQVIGRRGYDEKVLAALGAIERALGRT